MSSVNIVIDKVSNFDYVIKRQRRKSIALHVLHDGSVELRAPKWVAEKELLKFVEQRIDWVIEQRIKRLQIHALRPKFCTGQHHYYLGSRYPLNVLKGTTSQSVLIDGTLCLFVSDPSSAKHVEAAMHFFYRQQAKQIFVQRMDHCYQQFPMQGLSFKPKPELKLRKMRRRWGSCSSKAVITLNTQLMKMPIECIDYVIIHELCHLWFFDHSKAFYRLLSQAMPEWRHCEQIIESIN